AEASRRAREGGGAAGRPGGAEGGVAGGKRGEERVETQEGGDVGGAHEDRLDRQEKRRRHAVDASEIEEEGPALPAQGQQQGRVTRLPVQETGPEGRLHERGDSREAPRRAPVESLAGLTLARYKARPWCSGGPRSRSKVSPRGSDRSRRSGGNGSRPPRPAAPGESRSPPRSSSPA